MHTMHLYLFNSIQLSASVSLHSYSVIFYYVCMYLPQLLIFTYIHIYVLIFFLAQYPQLKLCLPVQPFLSVLLLSLFPPSLFRT